MTLTEVVATRIRELLDERDISLYKFARKSTVHPGTLNDIMYCKNKSLNMKTIHLVIKGFGITYGEFFGSPVFDNNEIEVD